MRVRLAMRFGVVYSRPLLLTRSQLWTAKTAVWAPASSLTNGLCSFEERLVNVDDSQLGTQASACEELLKASSERAITRAGLYLTVKYRLFSKYAKKDATCSLQMAEKDRVVHRHETWPHRLADLLVIAAVDVR